MSILNGILHNFLPIILWQQFQNQHCYNIKAKYYLYTYSNHKIRGDVLVVFPYILPISFLVPEEKHKWFEKVRHVLIVRLMKA